MIYVGKAREIRKRVELALLEGGSHTRGDLPEEIASIDFLVTETEAEALLAEQQFIKRHRPIFNIRLRDDKSYPYIGISLDEEFPRVYFTRERHRPSASTSAPTRARAACARRSTSSASSSSTAPARAPSPGGAPGTPASTTTSSAARRPCVGYIDRDEYRRNIEVIIDFLSGRYREIEDDLERKMEEASDAEEYERAGVFRDRLEAVRSLLRAPARRRRGRSAPPT